MVMGALKFLECILISTTIIRLRHDGGEEGKRVSTEGEQIGRRLQGGLGSRVRG